jgi:hypothetical protein
MVSPVSAGSSTASKARSRSPTTGVEVLDPRAVRVHGLIARIRKSRRYPVTDAGLQDALLFTQAHDHLLRTAMAELTDPSPPWPSARDRAAHR